MFLSQSRFLRVRKSASLPGYGFDTFLAAALTGLETIRPGYRRPQACGPACGRRRGNDARCRPPLRPPAHRRASLRVARFAISPGRSGMTKIRVGAWRDDRTGPMRVLSGPMGKEHVHFEAPKAARLGVEMRRFLHWFETSRAIDPVGKAGMAHLWFVTIHPFDDGNGRIARAIADRALARSENSPQRFYSMSAQIRQERKAYYDILEQTQKGTLDITPWMDWFLACLGRAIDGAQTALSAVLTKARFWERVQSVPLNDRQRLVLNRL